MDLFSINPQGDFEYGPSEGSLEIHNSIVAGDLKKAIRLSKGDGERISGEVRDKPQHLYVPSHLNLSKAHYLHKKMTYQGLKISIENSAGSTREGIDSDGHPWRSLLHFDYGYLVGVPGIDGDALDCFVGPYPNAKKVFIIHQKNVKTGKFDEDKVMLGWKRKSAARRDYLKNYDRSDQIMGISTMTMVEFKKKLPSTNDKPIMIKSTIRAHQRRTKSGKTIMVRQHQDTRTKKDKPTKGGSYIKVGAVPTGYIKIPGTKITKIGQIAAIFKGMKDDAREKYWIVGADKNDNIVSVELHSMGGIDVSTVDSKVILGVLRSNGAKKFWGIHNHPSGGVTASIGDVSSMKKLSKIAHEVGIEHQNDVIIHGGKDTYSVFGPSGHTQGEQEDDEKGWVEYPVTELKVISRKKIEEGMPTKVTSGAQVAQLGHWIQSKHGQGVWGVTLNTQNEITGYYLMGDNKMSDKAQQDKYGKALLKHMLDSGATNSVMVGTSLGTSEVDKFNKAINEYMSPKGYTYLDSVFETGQGYYSAAGTSYHQVAKSILLPSRIRNRSRNDLLSVALLPKSLKIPIPSRNGQAHG